MARIMLIDDDGDFLKAVTKRLKDAGHVPHGFTDPGAALKEAKENPPDLILLDLNLPGFSGAQLKEKLSADPQLNAVPVIFLTAQMSAEDRIRGLDLGADDYITKPFETKEFLARVQNVILRYQRYRTQTTTDALTGLMNRMAFETSLSTLFRTAERYKRVFSLLVLDLDGFKALNDTKGHVEGDKLLKWFAVQLVKQLRLSDMVARFGGDEFAILMPETAETAAAEIKSRIQHSMMEIAEGDPEGALFRGVSIGVAGYREDIHASEELFSLADKRMYEDKQIRHSRGSEERQLILVVEDEADIRKAVVFRLEKAGFRVVYAADGSSALAVAKAMHPDLILLDLMLPKVSGEEICKALREDDDPLLASTPIVMLSAKGTDADKIVGRVIGATYYMTKPFNSDDLVKNAVKFARKREPSG